MLRIEIKETREPGECIQDFVLRAYVAKLKGVSHTALVRTLVLIAFYSTRQKKNDTYVCHTHVNKQYICIFAE